MTVGQIVVWDSSDDDVPAGHAGKVVAHPEHGKSRVEFPNGTWRFDNADLTSCGYSVKDRVTWTSSDSDIPIGTVGTVQGIHSSGSVRVTFPGGTFRFKHDQLRKAKGGVTFAASPDEGVPPTVDLRAVTPAETRGSTTITFHTTSFAEGASRKAFKAEVTKGTVCGFPCGTKLVIKALKPEYYNAGIRIGEQDLLTQETAIQYAKLFNKEHPLQRNGRTCKTHFRKAGLYTMNASAANKQMVKGETVLLEREIKGTYQKFNSNSGWSSGTCSTADAFSHWSWVRSGGNMLICDIQGHRSDGTVTLDGESEYNLFTDPAILSKSQKFGGTDLGQDGICNWFAHHQCNDLCRAFKIDSKLPSRTRSRAARLATTYNNTSL